jgi:glycosyltransferase involved in cell wall biosynthesis
MTDLKHVSWAYPIVAQTEKEDFIKICKDAGGGEILSVKKLGHWGTLKRIWRKDVHSNGRGFPFPEMCTFFARRSIYTPYSDTLGMKWWTRATRRFIFNRYDKIVCMTRYGQRNIIKEGINPKKTVYLPLPVDCDYFSKASGGDRFRKKHGLGKNEPFVLMVGIRPVKNSDIVVEACEKAGVRAVLVGPYKRAELEATWKGGGFEWYLPPERVLKSKSAVFAGQIKGKELLEALDAATIFVNSSDHECFGLAVYEAASAGVPLCLPDYGSFEVFKGHALFHNSRDSEQLSKNILKYLGSKELRKKNGKKAAETAKKYNYPTVRKMYDRFYKEFFRKTRQS